MKKNHKIQLLISLALGVLGMFYASSSQGQSTITWLGATNVSGDTDVSTLGTSVFAYDWNYSEQIVNGVTFTAPGPGVTLSPDMNSNYRSFLVGQGAPATSVLSLNYQDTLTGGQYAGATPGIVTLNNLSLGHNYEVQLWVDDSRSGDDTRSELVEDIFGDNVTLQYNWQVKQGGYGQYTIGDFTAIYSTNFIELSSGTASQINAIQLRDLGLGSAIVQPYFTPPPGNYLGAQTVTIQGEPGATVFYTTNGNPPTTTSTSGGVGTGTATVSIPTASTVTIIAMETNTGQTGTSPTISGNFSTFSTPTVPTWNLAFGGSWAQPSSWVDDVIANGVGVTADFSELTLGGAPGSIEDVTCDSSVTVGNLIFGDKANASSWEIDPGEDEFGFAGTLTLAGPSPTITVVNQSVNFTVPIAGDNGLTVVGAGTLDLTAQNTYTGGTIVSNHATLFANGANTSTGAVGQGDVSVLPGGTIYVGGDESFVGSSTADVLSISIAQGGLIINTNAADTAYITNYTYITNFTTNSGTVTTNITTNYFDTITNIASSTSHLNALVLDGGTLSAVNTNGSGTWLLDFGVYTLGDGKTSYITGGNVALTQSGGTAFSILGNDTVVLSTLLAHTGSADNGFVKTGTGTLTLEGTTNTTVGNEAVNGGTLNGNGQTDATLTVNSGGTLAPGSPTTIGQLGFTNLVLNAGSTTVMKINPTANTNDSIVGDVGTPLNAVTYGGTLTVSNIGGTLASGDSYPLFYAKKYNGAFATYNLPTLPSGLHWNVGQLTVNGSLAVVTGPSAPTFNPTAGGFMTPQLITISDLTPGATIYYTTDGSPPSSSSTLYSTPFSLSVPGTLTLNAIAYVAGVPSAVSSGTFIGSTTAVWSQLASPASWSVNANWSNGILANLAGGTADFSELTMSNAFTVTLDGNWTIGNMIFGDKGNAHAYSITPGTGTTDLTLAGPSPTITLQDVNTNATNANLQTSITANIAGSNGWTIVGTPIPATNLNLNTPEVKITAENLITGGTVLNGASVYDNGGETSYGIFGRGNLVLSNGASVICNGSYWSLTGADPSLVFTVTIGPGCTVSNVGAQAQILPNTIMDGGILSAGEGNDANGNYGSWGFTGNVSTMGDGKTSYMIGGGASPNNGDISFLSEGATVFNVGAGDTLIITMAFNFGWKNQDNGWIKEGPGEMEQDSSIACEATNVGTIDDGLFRGTGSLNGPIIVNPGGTIGAGTVSNIGTLNLTKTLILSPGSFTSMRIDAASNINDEISVGQTLFLNGTLVVTNIGGTLAQYQFYQVLSAATYSGSFNNYVLPALPVGLSWNTAQLATSGSLEVVPGCVPPTFSLPSGGYTGGAQQVTLSTLTPGATIYYTVTSGTTGTAPTTSSPSAINSVTLTVPAGVTETIEAYTHETGYSPDSDVVTATYTTVSGSAVWTNAAAGTNSWAVSGNWSNSIIANQTGGTADFSQLTLAGNAYVNLNGAWTVGNLVFGDQGNKYTWEIDNGTNESGSGAQAGPLTLDNGATPPTITVNNETTTIGAYIVGLNGFNKTGPGTLVFTGSGTNVWGHFRGPITTSGGPLVFSNNTPYSQEVPPDGVTGTGPVTFVGAGINFLGNVTTGGNQSYTSGSGTAYEIGGGYIATNVYLKATNGASISFVSGCLGYKNSNGGSLTLDTTEGNGTINLNVSIGGGALYFPMEYLTANSGTGALNVIGSYSTENDPLYAGVGDRVPPVETLTGAINFAANYEANVAINMYLNPTLPSTAAGSFSGSLSLWVAGPSSITFTGTNTYTGTTTVTNGGTMLVDGKSTGSPVTVASGATLGGTGEVGGPTIIESGGTLEAGGVLTMGNLSLGDQLTLSPGSSTVLRIDAANGTHDAIAGPPIAPIVINYGGTLTVNNIAGTLALGDSFQLFNAASYNGNFSSFDLPALGSGLGWSFTPSTGTLSVVQVSQPTQPSFIPTASSLVGTSFAMSFSGPTGSNYTVLMTTNLALPTADWITVSSGTFTSSPVDFTDAHATNKVQFYKVEIRKHGQRV